MLDNTLKTIQQTHHNIDMATKGPTIENLVQQVRGDAAQSLELVLPLKSSISVLQTNIK